MGCYGKSSGDGCKAKGYYKMTEFSDYARLSLGSPDRRRVDEFVNRLIDRDSTVPPLTGRSVKLVSRNCRRCFLAPKGCIYCGTTPKRRLRAVPSRRRAVRESDKMVSGKSRYSKSREGCGLQPEKSRRGVGLPVTPCDLRSCFVTMQTHLLHPFRRPNGLDKGKAGVIGGDRLLQTRRPASPAPQARCRGCSASPPSRAAPARASFP
jgi:hypothetical protein